jgi:hypothetical protein
MRPAAAILAGRQQGAALRKKGSNMYESVAGNVAARFVEKEIEMSYGYSSAMKRGYRAAHEVSAKFAHKKKPGRFVTRLKSAFPALIAPRVTEWSKRNRTVLSETIEGLEASFPDIRNPGKSLFAEMGMGLYRYYFGNEGTARYANPGYMSQHAIKRCLHRGAFTEDEMATEVAKCLHLAACLAEHVPEGEISGNDHVSVLIPYRDGALCALLIPDASQAKDEDHFGPSGRGICCVIRTYLSPSMIHEGGARRLGVLDCVLEDAVAASRCLKLDTDLVRRVGLNMQKWDYTPRTTVKAPQKAKSAEPALEDA